MKITIVTTMRNEGPHLLEWVAHHRAIGVTDFLVFTNDCSDGTELLLELLPCVTHVPLESDEKPPQWRALKMAWDHPVVEESDWLMCLDCDEFINLNNSLPDLPNLIHKVDSDAIILPWRLFGHADQIDASVLPSTQRFTRAAPLDMMYPAIGNYFKTLFRRNGPFRQLGVHRPKQKKSTRQARPVWADGSGRRVSDALAVNDEKIMHWGGGIARDLVQLNHYSVRSVAEFMIKRDRGLPNHRLKEVGLTYWVERNFNSVEDNSILWMSEGTQSVLSDFNAVPNLNDVEEQARYWHEKRLATLLSQPDELNLYGRLILAGSSTPPSSDKSLELIRAYQAAHSPN
ncbi:MAG: glycosyltransferase family 2 protein [Litoreibacter sp.]